MIIIRYDYIYNCPFCPKYFIGQKGQLDKTDKLTDKSDKSDSTRKGDIQPNKKRTNSDVANSTADELQIIHTDLDTIKDQIKNVVTKSDMAIWPLRMTSNQS